MTSPIIKLDDVHTWLGNNHVLHGISFAVSPGEVVVLLGGNGSGKTTTLRTALGLVPAQSGTVELFGTPIQNFRDWSRVGYVPQHGRVQVANATVKEVVNLGRLAHRRFFQFLTRTDRAAVDEALERVGMTEFISRPMTRLSGGQQQRALIARALAGQADLLVLDEPLAGLDIYTQRSLADLLAALHSEGLTILLVLHELGAMESILQRGIMLRSGRVSYDGPLPAGSATEPHCGPELPDAHLHLGMEG